VVFDDRRVAAAFAIFEAVVEALLHCAHRFRRSIDIDAAHHVLRNHA
jgi:hypothetical protein